MIKRFHEAPKSIFQRVQKMTDGDYALVHLFEEDPEYYLLFHDAVRAGREVILDNSVFELGESFDNETFARWVAELKPAWYIVPDVLENCDATLDRFFTFIEAHPQLPGRRIGVVQGGSYEDLVYCYTRLEPHCDMVAFSFDYSFLPTMAPDHVRGPKTPLHLSMLGRCALLTHMEAEGHINTDKPHHLLGCFLPQEMKYYGSMEWPWIYSVDTSNPVVHGLKGIEYKAGYGLDAKESQKLCELISEVPTPEQVDAIEFNIVEFRRYCNG